MFVGFDLGPDFFDVAGFVDEEGHAVDAHVVSAHEGFLAPDSVGVDDFLLVVNQQGEWQVEFVDEFLVGFGGVRADAENHRAAFFEVGKGVAESAGFLGAAGGVVLGVKVKNDVFPFELTETDGLAGGGLGLKVWSQIALF